MAKKSAYVAKHANHAGFIAYTDEEHAIWQDLFQRQQENISRYACQEYQQALEALNFPRDRIPQCEEISNTLFDATGWKVAPVAALISFEDFFQMLANKVFPAASFIRCREEMDYLQEPDIFHEILGHTPLLLDHRFAEFTHNIGKMGVNAAKQDYSWLARLYWFTIEFGLINTARGMQAYGAGIVSSYSELPYSVESSQPERKPFELIEVLRTPYRIDIHQCIYFTLENFDMLFELAKQDLMPPIKRAQQLGLYKPCYPLGERA